MHRKVQSIITHKSTSVSQSPRVVNDLQREIEQWPGATHTFWCSIAIYIRPAGLKIELGKGRVCVCLCALWEWWSEKCPGVATIKPF